MKKIFVIALAALLLLASCATGSSEPKQAKEVNEFDQLYPGKVLDQTTGATYRTLQEALDAAGDGDTIIMCKNETVDTTVRISKPVTLDFNGHTLACTLNGAALFVRSLDSKATLENVTIKNGTIIGYPKGAGTASLFGFVMVKGVLVENMTAISNVQANEDEACAFYLNGVEGIARNMNVTGKTVLYNKSNGIINVTIEGGTFVKDPNCPTDNIIKLCGDATDDPGKVFINNAKMTGELEIASNPPATKIAGGTYSVNISSYFLADGYKCVKNGAVYDIVAK